MAGILPTLGRNRAGGGVAARRPPLGTQGGPGWSPGEGPPVPPHAGSIPAPSRSGTGGLGLCAAGVGGGGLCIRCLLPL